MKAVLILAMIALVASLARGDSSLKVKTCKPGSYKVTDVLKPVYYDLLISIHPDSMTYTGTVAIALEKTAGRSRGTGVYAGETIKEKLGLSPWKQIVLNVDREFVQIDESSIFYLTYGNVKHAVSSVCYDDESGHVVLKLRESIFDPSVSGGRIFMNFSSKKPAVELQSPVENRKLVQVFDPALAARQKFPCFDSDPTIKTRFALTVVRPWNARVKSSVGKEGLFIYQKDVSEFFASEDIALNSMSLYMTSPK